MMYRWLIKLLVLMTFTISYIMLDYLYHLPLYFLIFTMLIYFTIDLVLLSHTPKKTPPLLADSDLFSHKIKDFIIQLNAFVAHMESIDQLYIFILDQAIHLIPNAQAGSFLLYNQAQDTFSFKNVNGYDYSTIASHVLKREETFLYQYTHGRMDTACIINNPLQFNQQFLGKTTYNAFREGNLLTLKSTLSAPIIIDGHLHGLINLDNLQSHTIFNEQDKSTIEYLVSQLSIIIKNALLLDKTIYLSRHDALTKLYNRRYIDACIDDLYHDAIANNHSLILAIIDMDELKYINDHFGHATGDKAIIILSQLLKHYFQNVGHLGRYGGDEFIVVIPHMTLAQVDDLFIEVNIALTLPNNKLEKFEHSLSYSYGISILPDDSTTLKELFKIADSRMYQNKLSKK